jgi:hypothetical protein
MFSNRTTRILTSVLFSLSVVTGANLAAEPPDLVNYQGVLRGSDESPLEGNHDMVFRFWSADIGGAEILVDSHTAAGAGAVTVSGGLFDVQLGSGTVSDGSGAGVYDTLGAVFADYSAVWLEIEIGGEILSPRVRVVTSPYAANAMHLGGKSGDQFVDTSSSVQSKLGRIIVGQASGTGSAYGVEGYGTVGGGYFKDSNSSGYARLGTADYGVRGYGNSGGGYFADLTSSGYAYVGYGDYGTAAYGNIGGGYFEDLNNSGYARAGFGDRGVSAHGNEAGGYFEDLNDGGYAFVGHGQEGISSYGNRAGGYFEDLDHSGYAYVGYFDYGIAAYGNAAGAGGYFENVEGAGRVWLADGDRGITASGTSGIIAEGSFQGGFFEDSDATGTVRLGYGDWGLSAGGVAGGGQFHSSPGGSRTDVAVGERGIWAKGYFAGGTFSHPDEVTYWADVSRERSGTTYKIYGTGSVSFAQNHPHDKDKLVVYAAPEGDEVATYTRGTARLVGGEARVELSETFAWVTNPDIGLTVHLTPVGEWSDLYVADKSTSEIVVRSREGVGEVEFDYLVYGLRIGFEQHAAVQIKDQEAFLPRRGASEEFFAEHPGLQRYSALERFKEMRAALGESTEIDLSRAKTLIAAIDEDREEIVAAARAEVEAERAEHLETPSEQRSNDELPHSVSPRDSEPTIDSAATTMAETTIDQRTWLPVAEPVELGDVLVLDPARPGHLRRAATLADPGVVGVAAGPSREAEGGGLEAPMADTRYALVKVDAGYGEIRPGDQLLTSPTPGHAMTAVGADSGAILGKALDSLEVGTGSIRVLLVTR